MLGQKLQPTSLLLPRTGVAEGEAREVSKCSEEIKNYIEERSGEDPLVKGVPEDKNPFKEKGGCVIA
ncbi:hypothetical protein EK904_005695 [Melospiza melodia maxima]|nr:hypothetical protein EK904_005695 [Melospiza melodia maxima]